MAYQFTSESVSAGHPDKVCDQISDLIVDLYLEQDPNARLGVETLATTNRIILAGEVKSSVTIDQAIINSQILELVKIIGYENQPGFNPQQIEITNLIHEQSADIALGVDEASENPQGAGDQGLMFGYATNETPNFMPAPLFYAHRLLQKLHELRINQYTNILGPDAKSQITFNFENNKPVSCHNILISTQHVETINVKDLEPIIDQVIEAVVPPEFRIIKPKILINPTGRFVIGGPDGDTGLTGRKIIVDSYGGAAPHGGGSFSGKDPSKVDRSAAYMMRYLAKNIVAAGLASKCTLQVAYSIGKAEPLSLYLNTQQTSKINENLILNWIKQNIDLTPKGIISHLQLKNPIYLRTASYGHFGRSPQEDGGFSWEKLDLVPALTKLL